MGLVADAVGVSKSGIFLGATAVIAVVTYSWLRGSGLPIIGQTGSNGTSDIFGGR
jgi:hypothetical protein|tara:strand:- start:468 stop:632 length:165 start_codon:yes stop_codon:yes gene_type:complete